MSGYIQVPVDSTGKRVDTVTLTDAGVEVHRQKIVMTGGSGTAEVVVVTNATPANTDMGLVVRQAGTAQVQIATPFTVNNISATVVVSGQVSLGPGTSNIGFINNISAPVVLAAGANNIGSINNISATVVVSGQVSLGPGTSNIGTINNISAAVVLAAGAANIGTINNISAAVVLAAGVANIGSINNISATVNTGLSFVLEKTTNSQVQIGDSANAAIRVNVVAGSAGGPSMTDNTTYSTGASLVAPAGYIFFSASATAVTDGRVAAARITDSRAVHVNFRNNAGTEIGTAANPISVKVENVSATASVVLAAGTANIGTLNNISATLSTVLAAGAANIGTINNISAAVVLAAGANNIGTINNISAAVVIAAGANNIGTINGISATVIVASGATGIMSASHGPKCVTASTSAVVTLVASPGTGLSVYITQLAITNAGTISSLARIGTSSSAATILMFCASAGGGFVMNFDPPWKLSASEAAICSVKPNSSGNTYFNVNFYVAA